MTGPDNISTEQERARRQDAIERGLPTSDPFAPFEGDELILPSGTVGAICRTKTGRDGYVVANADGGTVCRPTDSVNFKHTTGARPFVGGTLPQLQPGQVEVLTLKDHTDAQSRKMWRIDERYAVDGVRAKELVGLGEVQIVSEYQPNLYRDNAK